ncbi:unnamed protein product [Mycena citricolor]|uniref:MARVEL domain-containing protein n=1 Tax=Mycena citricolor TaxID=2018698 RepID=A0AAD2I0K6_9AGAR|nr:unnamed protein product [Mycena citricolor]
MAGYHPLLFTLIALVAMAELGLSAYWVHIVQHQVSSRFKSLVILLLFNSCWTTLFAGAYVFFILDGALHELASIGSSSIWLAITAILWGVAAGLFHPVRGGGSCNGEAVLSFCRQTLALEAIAWTEMGLCILTILAACFWARSSRRSYVSVAFCLNPLLFTKSSSARKLLRLNKTISFTRCLSALHYSRIHDLSPPNLVSRSIIPHL